MITSLVTIFRSSNPKRRNYNQFIYALHWSSSMDSAFSRKFFHL